VQKFGGSSVASAEGRAAVLKKIQQALAAGQAPVIVVSAMGRKPDPYATDTLIGLLSSGDLGSAAVDAREKDMLMACGETISIVVMAHLLRAHGLAAVALTGSQAGVLTDDRHGEALVRSIDPRRMLALVEAGRIPVVAGFQGSTAEGETTTLGRGGSDTSAVALAVALRAQAVEIYSDVEGVMTVDPRIYDGAQLIPQLTFEELGELTAEGSRVMHARSVDLAAQHELPMFIRGTYSEHPGTVVRAEMTVDALEKQRVVTCITPHMPMAQVIVDLRGVADKDGVRADLFDRLSGAGISLDLINICRDDLYFIVKQELIDAVEPLLAPLPYSVRRDCAKLAVVGVGMRGTPGVVARVQRVLHRAGVPILHSTDSNITVSCLIAAGDVPRAVEVLHREFLPSAAG
jgi:aspartate kinase